LAKESFPDIKVVISKRKKVYNGYLRLNEEKKRIAVSAVTVEMKKIFIYLDWLIETREEFIKTKFSEAKGLFLGIIRDIVLHEIAHVLNFESKNMNVHGPEWQEKKNYLLQKYSFPEFLREILDQASLLGLEKEGKPGN